MKQSGRESGTSATGGPLASKNSLRAKAKAGSQTIPANVSFWDLKSIPPRVLGLILFAGVLFAYQPAWHAGFIWDDDVYVTENKLLTAPDGLRRIWFSTDSPSQYFPLVYTSFRLQGRIEEAAAQWSESIRRIPNKADAHCHLAALLTRQGNREEARVHFEEALRLEPDSREAQQGLRSLRNAGSID